MENTITSPQLNNAMDGQSFSAPIADVSHIRRKWLDLPYASLSPAQKLDIYLPDEGDGPFPILLYIHGGGFAFEDKRRIHLLPFLKGIERGYAVVGVDYRLSGEALFPAGIQDVKAAIRWLRANSKQYQLDGSKIAACGGSSGGNYAAMICLTDHVAELEDLSLGNPEYPCDVQAALDWFGPTDFLKMDAQLDENGYGPSHHADPDSPESMYLGAKLADVTLKVELANPMTYIHKNMPPLLDPTWTPGHPGAGATIHYLRSQIRKIRQPGSLRVRHHRGSRSRRPLVRNRRKYGASIFVFG